MARTYYDVLGVAPEADGSEIRRAYREQVKELHPDRNDAPDAGDRFREVVRAEAVLNNECERERYDRLGHAAYVRTTGRETATASGEPWTSRRAPEEIRRDAERTVDPGADEPGGSTDATAQGEGRDAGRDIHWGTTGVDRHAHRRHVSEAGTVTDAGGWSPTIERSTPGTRAKPEGTVLGSVCFLLYPLFLYSVVSPWSGPVVNVVVGGCTLLTIGYLLTIPRIALPVFGIWGFLAPLAILASSDLALASSVGLTAVVATWVPFWLAAVVSLAVPD